MGLEKKEEKNHYVSKKDIDKKVLDSRVYLKENKFYETIRHIPDTKLSEDTIERALAGYSAAKSNLCKIGAPKDVNAREVNTFYEMYCLYLGVAASLYSHSKYVENDFGTIEAKLETEKGEYFLMDSFISNYVEFAKNTPSGKALALKTKAYLKSTQSKLESKLKDSRYSRMLGHIMSTKIYFDTSDEKLEFTALDYFHASNGIVMGNGSEKITLKDVGGNGKAKRAVEEIILMCKHPEICKKYCAEIPKGLLFYGHPGTGKTMLAKAMAGEINADFHEVKIDEILSKWVGESEKNLRMTLEHRKGIIFYDEFDSLGKTKDEGSEASRNIVNLLATIWEGISSQEDVINIAATNNLELIDPKLLRAGRFDEIIEFTIATKDELKEIFSIHLRKASLKSGRNLYENISLDEITEKVYRKSENCNGHEKRSKIVRVNEIFGGIVGSDVREIVKRVNRKMAIREIKGEGKDLLPSEQDFLEIIQEYERE